MELCFSHRAVDLDFKYIDVDESSSRRVIMTCVLPLSQIVTDFFDKLKSRSCGFASFEYVSRMQLVSQSDFSAMRTLAI
jgi:translation factor GUF1, mitochondrial